MIPRDDPGPKCGNQSAAGGEDIYPVTQGGVQTLPENLMYPPFPPAGTAIATARAQDSLRWAVRGYQ